MTRDIWLKWNWNDEPGAPFQWSDLDRRVVIVDPDPAQHAFGLGVAIFAMASRGAVVVVPTASPVGFADPSSERVIPALRVERQADLSSDALQALAKAEAQHRALLVSPREEIVLDDVLLQSATHGPHPDLVIVSGQTGAEAWPMRPQWARRLKKLCDDADVAFAFMGWGAWVPEDIHRAALHEFVARYQRSVDGAEHLALPKGL